MPYKNKEKQREYQRRWIKKRREEYFKNKFCVVCGSIENLELDHIYNVLKVSHRIWSWSEERRLNELDVCQVLCKDCHNKKTIAHRQQFNAPCGTEKCYNRGCRCDKCREAHRQYMKEYRGQ